MIQRFLLLVGLTLSAIAAPEKWAPDIAKFKAADAKNPPAQNAVVFIGSSSIVLWKSLAKDFPDHTVINRGFGGSELTDSTFYLDQIVIPYQPRVVVIYAGENDLNAGKSAELLASDFAALCSKLHTALPTTRIVFISVKPSPSRWKIHEKMAQANALIAAYCAQDQRRRFVDVWKPMLDVQGQPRPELFLADRLHMNPAGYAIWTPLVAPHLR